MHRCTVARDRWPIKTDHYPILTTLEVPVAAAQMQQRHNFREVDWDGC